MRKAYLLIALACITAVACKRKTTDTTNVTLPVAYVLNGVTDVMVERDSMAMLDIMVSQEPGRPQENVTVTVTGLPAGVTAKVTPASGTPDYLTTITFRASDAAVVGQYPVKITASSASGSRTYDINLNVMAISECATKVMGSYIAVDQCDTNAATAEYMVNVTPAFTKANRINFQGFFAGSPTSVSVFANLDCNAKTFTLPKQNIMFYEVLGSGHYKGDTIKVFYEVRTSFDTVNCSTVLYREP